MLRTVALQGKLVAEITRDDIRELVRNHAAESLFIDFKEIVFHPAHNKPNDELDSLMTDLAAFANAFGGHIVVGIEDRNDRAWQFRQMPEAEARRVARKLKDLAIQHIKPAIVPLEIVPFRMEDFTDDWVVIVGIPEGQAKPHMSSFDSQTFFPIRDGNRNRSMTVDEIQRAFLVGPQQSLLAGIFRELQSVRALVEMNAPKTRSWWRFW